MSATWKTSPSGTECAQRPDGLWAEVWKSPVEPHWTWEVQSWDLKEGPGIVREGTATSLEAAKLAALR